jgi:hypothetical protein
MMAKMNQWAFANALVKGGVFTKDQMNNIRRVVIDCPWDGPPIMYVEMFTSQEALDVFTSLEGIQIIGVPTAEPEAKKEPIVYYTSDMAAEDLRLKEQWVRDNPADEPDLKSWGPNDVSINQSGTGYEVSDDAIDEIVRASFKDTEPAHDDQGTPASPE